MSGPAVGAVERTPTLGDHDFFPHQGGTAWRLMVPKMRSQKVKTAAKLQFFSP